MQQIATFMMSKKFIPVVLVLVCASLFIAFKSQGKNEGSNNENPKTKHAKILRNPDRTIIEWGTHTILDGLILELTNVYLLSTGSPSLSAFRMRDVFFAIAE